jgi:flagellin-like hook-associated protein FlgL
MSNVALSKGVRENLLSLQNTAASMGVTQHRLATGKKVNSALDNPQNFFVSQGLSNRAADLSTLLDDMGQGVQTLGAANNGVTAIAKLVASAQATLRQVQQTILTHAALTGSKALTETQTLDGNLGLNAGDKLEVTVGTGSSAKTASYSVVAGDTVKDLVDALNTGLSTSGKAEVAGGKLVIGAADAADLSVKFTKASAGPNATTGAELFGQDLTAGITAKASGYDTRQKLAAQYDDLLTQIDQLAGDAGYNGVNLLGGDDLKITFNEGASSAQLIKGVRLDAAGLKLSASAGGFGSDADVASTISALGDASTQLRTQASTFGSNLLILQNRQDFTKAMIGTLQGGSDNLTLADTNEEAANLLALQTRQQLSQSALSMAAQADQSVLKLFG